MALAQVGAGQVAPPVSPVENLLPGTQPKPAPRVQPQDQANPADLDDAPAIAIDAAEIVGSTVDTAKTFVPRVKALVGKTVKQGEIADIVRDLQTKYREDGYFLTVVRGTVEPVEGKNTLRVRVIEGFISSVKIEGDIGPAGVLVYNFLNKLTELRPVTLPDVERALLLAQDIPGVSVRAVLRPAAGEVGGVELIGQVARTPFNGIVNYDNRGPGTAGPPQLLLGGYANSFTSFGERSEIILFNTPFTNEQVFGQASLEAFVGSDGTKIRGYAGYSLSAPGDVLAATGYRGRLFIAGISASHPLIRTRPLSLSVNAAFDLSHAEIDIFGANSQRQRQSNSHLRILRLGSTLDVQDELLGATLPGANTITFTAHKGIEGLGSQHKSDALASRPGEVYNFIKFTTEATRVQTLFDIDDYSFALKLQLGAQYTPNILPPNEKYFLGGSRFVRGFFSGEVTGDRAVGGTAELQVNTGTEGSVFGLPYDVKLQYYAFYDAAGTWDRAPGDPRRHLESGGIGIRAQLTPEILVELEGVQRFTLKPTGSEVSPEARRTAFIRVLGRF